MSGPDDEPYSEDTYNKDIRTNGGEYTGRDSYDGDYVRGDKVVNPAPLEHSVRISGSNE